LKKHVFQLPALLLCLLLTACSGGGPQEKPVSMYDLQTAMLAADSSLPDMLTVNSAGADGAEMFSHLSHVDYEKVDGFFLAYSATGLADEVAVVRLKEAGHVEEMKSSLHDHVEGRVKLYRNYQPDQMRRVEEGLIFTRGHYAVLIISDQPSRIRAAFEQAVE